MYRQASFGVLEACPMRISLAGSRCLIVLLALAVSSSAAKAMAQNNPASESRAVQIDGYFTDDSKKVVLKDAIAFWSGEVHELSVVCYPFALSGDDVDALRRDPGSAVTYGRRDKRRNPDPDRWAQTPLMVLKFCFDPHKERTVDNVTTTFGQMWYGSGTIPLFADRYLGTTGGMLNYGKGQAHRAQAPQSHVRSVSLTGDGDQRMLKLVSVGNYEYKWERYGWDLQLTTRVYDTPPRELGQVREWRDSTGKYSVRAGFVEKKEGQVVLKKPTGQTIAVPIDRLSETDRLLLASFGVIDDTDLLNHQKEAIKSLDEAKIGLWKVASRPGMPVTVVRLSQQFQDSQLAQLKYFPRAQKLEIMQNVTPQFFQRVGELRQISSLSFQRVSFDQATIRALCQLSTLKELWLTPKMKLIEP